MHAAIAVVGGVLVVLFGRRLSRLLHPVEQPRDFSDHPTDRREQR
jgi:hypothetical protein